VTGQSTDPLETRSPRETIPVLANLSVRLAVIFLAALVYAGGHPTTSFVEQAIVVCEIEENRTTSDERNCVGPGVLVPGHAVTDLVKLPVFVPGRGNDLFSTNLGPKPHSTGPPVI